MPRNYQRTKNNPYFLSREIYNQVLWIVKGYETTRQDYYNIIGYSLPVMSGMPRGTTALRPTESKAFKVATVKFAQLSAVEKAFESIPPELQSGIYQKLAHDTPYDTESIGRAVWSDYEAEYLYHVARLLNMIEE